MVEDLTLKHATDLDTFHQVEGVAITPIVVVGESYDNNSRIEIFETSDFRPQQMRILFLDPIAEERSLGDGGGGWRDFDPLLLEVNLQKQDMGYSTISSDVRHSRVVLDAGTSESSLRRERLEGGGTTRNHSSLQFQEGEFLVANSKRGHSTRRGNQTISREEIERVVDFMSDQGGTTVGEWEDEEEFVVVQSEALEEAEVGDLGVVDLFGEMESYNSIEDTDYVMPGLRERSRRRLIRNVIGDYPLFIAE